MNRTTLIGLIALVGIAAGTLLWRYWTQQKAIDRQKEITTVLENTEENLQGRITALEELLAKYPGDRMIERVAVYQILKTYVELNGDAATLIRAAERFLATDSSGAAYDYVASVYADRGINAAEGLRYANRALLEAEEMERPEAMTDSQWQAQRRMMIGECEHIRGKLYALNMQPRTALTALRAARDSVPDSPSILFDVAKGYEQAGEPDSALSVYLDVVRLRYDDAEAREAIGRLYPERRDRWVSVESVLHTLVERARAARKETILTERISDPAPQAPNFTLNGLDGEKIRLDSLRGKTVVLYLWATWCVPCQRQLPLMEEAYAAYGSRPDVAFLAVSLDQRPELIKPFVKRRGYTLPVAHGDREVYTGFQVEGLPTLILIDPQGKVRFRQLGHSDVGDFVEELGWRIEALTDTNPARPS